MSYAAQPPTAAEPPAAPRPATVTLAVALLWAMAVAGLTYAVGMVAVTPGVVGRFRDAAGSEAAENFVSVVWLISALALVLALLVVALFAVLGIALRRGSRLARAVTLGVCGLGILGGCGTLAVLAAERSGEALPGSVGEALSEAYPEGWIVLNIAVAVAQVIGYLVVGVLLLAAPGEFFGRTAPAGTALPGFVPPSQIVAPSTGWAAPQSQPFVTGGSEPDQFSDQPAPSKSEPNPEDEYWSRP
ncbi:hypothetical protein Aca07nite_36120 [Actinoplanes capillaceus]|uniref:DUF2567 domain-containing protein n=1 Tax=Actinoplanes campanulatus TaxID=113559 RepID=A0ABQ3WJC9_9ACTN|nr:hypothetical protein [Actinoplanes capillaceus]GID46337.1 hypothetical protein Aca07nite_36120 [Actinoplanes capillaceus]